MLLHKLVRQQYLLTMLLLKVRRAPSEHTGLPVAEDTDRAVDSLRNSGRAAVAAIAALAVDYRARRMEGLAGRPRSIAVAARRHRPGALRHTGTHQGYYQEMFFDMWGNFSSLTPSSSDG
ncbi:MAG: hypothetical protein QOC96_1045 [Acidobacteriota bacterium]|jgi:hypothetical protein|nr:hypothetical protein [Acidobacteriota bacterium]